MTEENVAVTPHVEEPAEELNEGAESTQNDATTSQQPHGMANDGTQYGEESPEVAKYLELFPGVELSAAIGSVVGIHNNVVDGAESAGDTIEIESMIADKLDANSQGEDNENVEDDGLEA